MKYIKQLLMVLFLSTISINCFAENTDKTYEQVTLWQFVSVSEMPTGSILDSDAFLTKYVKYRGKKSSLDKYILMEGWENGWQFFSWENEKWTSFATSQEMWNSDFALGYFNNDDYLDIVLYNALEEENFTDSPLPPMPRLFLGDDQSFILSTPSCSPPLHGVFSSKLQIYKSKYSSKPIPDFLKPLILREEKNVNEVCEGRK